MDSSPINHKEQALIRYKEKLGDITKSTKIPYYIDDSADWEQVYAIFELASEGKPFMMTTVPEWIQKHYLVKKSTMTVQAFYVNGKLTFHKHWPEHNYIYKEEAVSMEKATNVRYNDKRIWEIEEYLGCEYFAPQYTGSHTANVPVFSIYGVCLPGGKKYIPPQSS